MLKRAFGDFDNYLAYMTEREQLIQSGDYDVGNWDEATGSLTEDELMILKARISPNTPIMTKTFIQKLMVSECRSNLLLMIIGLTPKLIKHF